MDGPWAESKLNVLVRKSSVVKDEFLLRDGCDPTNTPVRVGPRYQRYGSAQALMIRAARAA